MPVATIDKVTLNYEVLGHEGDWVALMSGARRNMDEMRGLATRVAAAGFRVLLHDRRNTGRSGLSLEGEGSEFEIWADDLCALAASLGVPRMIVGGSSSGCRAATILALRHRAAIKGLVMMRVTGGAFAVNRLSQVYYGQYIDAVRRGGMREVCKTDHFRDLIAIDPARRAVIMGWDPQRFLAVMTRWQADLESGIDDPMLGASEAQLKAIDFPVCVLPGNDRTHAIAAGLAVHGLIPGAELHELRTDQLEADLIPLSEWASDDRLAPPVIDFLRRVASGARAA